MVCDVGSRMTRLRPAELTHRVLAGAMHQSGNDLRVAFGNIRSRGPFVHDMPAPPDTSNRSYRCLPRRGQGRIQESNTRAPKQQFAVPVEVFRATLTSRLTSSTKVEPASTGAGSSIIRPETPHTPETNATSEQLSPTRARQRPWAGPTPPFRNWEAGRRRGEQTIVRNN